MLYKLVALLVLTAATPSLSAEEAAFVKAQPIWPEGREKEMNLTVGFRAVFERPEEEAVSVRVAASTIYRAYINGVFFAHGPARGPHGWYRVDGWDISDHLQPGRNTLVIEVVGYNVNSYYLLDQPSFVQAEVTSNDRVLAATDAPDGDFEAAVLAQRVQKVERYSFQRPFSEVWRLDPASDLWRKDLSVKGETVPCARTDSKRLLARRVPRPEFNRRPALRVLTTGTVAPRQDDVKPRHLRGLGDISEQYKGYPMAELTTIPSLELQRYQEASREKGDRPLRAIDEIPLSEGGYAIVDLGKNFTGFIGATITCAEPTRLFLTFDEILSDGGDVDFMRLDCANIVALELQPGSYEFESFEPYSMRYIKPVALEGACVLTNVHLREYVNPDVKQARFEAPDERLNRLFEAGVETFVQNATDVFMDCPHRERAGWLCDSFFTARSAMDLSGNTLVEKNFLENYLLPESYPHLPAGMLPMCYPSDHNNGVFIPNWAMWFVLELEEYLGRSGDRAMVDNLKPKVYGLFEYFRPFENSDGLLEKLESWVFVEWSAANQFVQDVNYPSNMLYAATLAAAGRLYSDEALLKKAEAIRETVRHQSYDGEFFVDNAVRKEGELEVSRNRTEVCQYFAFYFDTATPESHPKLWRKLTEDFGPDRPQTKKFPEIHPANSFVGNMLRAELLSRYGLGGQLMDESIDYLLYMADRTGTLWENVGTNASCNHGFASHIVHTLYRDVLGLRTVDRVNKRIVFQLCEDVKIPRCSGTMPTPDGPIHVEWRNEEDGLKVNVKAPAGYVVESLSAEGRAATLSR